MIAEREDLDARVIYRDDHVVAFFPDDPATLGHTLVVPRKHVPDIWMIDEVSAGRVAAVSVKIADLIRGVLDPRGLNVRTQAKGRHEKTTPKKCPRQDSNLRPSAPEADALSTELLRHSS